MKLIFNSYIAYPITLFKILTRFGEGVKLGFPHPAKIQPVIGTANPARIRACADAEKVELSREEWYSLYLASRGRALP